MDDNEKDEQRKIIKEVLAEFLEKKFNETYRSIGKWFVTTVLLLIFVALVMIVLKNGVIDADRIPALQH